MSAQHMGSMIASMVLLNFDSDYISLGLSDDMAIIGGQGRIALVV